MATTTMLSCREMQVIVNPVCVEVMGSLSVELGTEAEGGLDATMGIVAGLVCGVLELALEGGGLAKGLSALDSGAWAGGNWGSDRGSGCCACSSHESSGKGRD